MIQAFLKDDSGATAIEYGLIAGLFSIAVLVSLTTLGASVDDTYTFINDAVVAATGTPSVEAPAEVVAIEPVLDRVGIAIQ